jgi:hypothetical protein
MSGYTPLPWYAAEPGDYGDYDGECIVVIGDDQRVAVVIGTGDESKANARLIETAPEMLEALEYCVSALSRIHDLGGFVTSAQRLANTVIAKATGCTP